MPVREFNQLKTGGKNPALPSVCITKVSHHFNESLAAKLSLENVSRAQPPRTLNLATSFVDDNCVKKMNSMESIGVCSLDADSTTHSDGSLSPSNAHHAIAENYTSSAYTLKSTSLILSNGSSSPIGRSLGNPELRIETFGDVTDRVATTSDREESTPDKQTSPTLKGKVDTGNELDPAHLPSYLGISCAISGYSGYSRYCHSRDNSPARVSSVSPSKLSIATSKSPRESCEIDPTLHEMSLLTNGNKPRSKTDSYICNKYFGGDIKASLESEPNYVSSQNITLRKISPVASSNITMLKNSPVATSNVTLRKNSPIGQQQRFYMNGVNGHHPGEPREDPIEDKICLNPLNEARGSPFTDGPKSLVQQRIESLFGQPASEVVQGGAIRVSRPKSRIPVEANISLRSPSCPPQAFRPSSRSPPVFRHITQDFKEQLRNATVPTKLSPVKPKLSPNKQLASLTISTTKETTKPLPQKAYDTNGYGPSKNQQQLRAASEPKTAFPTALSLVSPMIEEKKPGVEVTVIDKPNQVGNGHYFIAKIDSATVDIKRQIKEAEEDSKLSGIPEEALGKLLSAAGKANLLIDQKFAQFRELCEKNISPDPLEPFPTTDEDLAGFWDMVLLQVDNVNETFSNLKKLKEKDWKEETVPYSRSKSQNKNQPKRNIRASTSKSNPTTPVHSAKASEKAKARDEQRKKLMEAKKRWKQQNPSETPEIAIFTPDQTS